MSSNGKARKPNWKLIADLRRRIAARDQVIRKAQRKYGGPQEKRARKDPGNKHK